MIFQKGKNDSFVFIFYTPIRLLVHEYLKS